MAVILKSAVPPNPNTGGSSFVIDPSKSPYNAPANNTGNAATGIQAAMDAAPTGSTILINGFFRCTTGLTVPDKRLKFWSPGGPYNGQLIKAADILLIDASGADSASHLESFRMEGVGLLGGDNSAWDQPLLRLYYGDLHRFEDCLFYNNWGCGAEMVECWDTEFLRCIFGFMGGEFGDKPAVSIRSKKTGTTIGQFGYSADSCNHIEFVDCDFDIVRDGGVWVVGEGVESDGTWCHNINLINSKFETERLYAFGHLIMYQKARLSRVLSTALTRYGNTLNNEVATPDLVRIQECSKIQIDGMMGEVSGPSPYQTSSVIRFDAGAAANDSCSVRNVLMRSFSGQDITEGLIKWAGTNNKVHVSNVQWQPNGASAPIAQGAPTSLAPGMEWTPELCGAFGDGTTDDSTAINAAITACSAAGGGDVVFRSPSYAIGVPIEHKRLVNLVGFHHPHWIGLPQSFGDTGFQTRILALAGFTTTGQKALIRIRESAIIGGSGTHGGGVKRLALDGIATGSSIDGIYIQGQCQEWIFEDLEILRCSGRGVRIEDNSGSVPQDSSWRNVISRDNTGVGFSIGEVSDHDFRDCVAASNGSHGWDIQGLGGGRLINCRAEWNLDKGLYVHGNVASEGLSITAFATDSNANTGVEIGACPDSRPIKFTGLQLKRDGRNLGTTYGLAVGIDGAGFAAPVIVSNLTCVVKPDDGGGTLYRPLVGVNVGANTDLLIINGGYIWGVNNAITNTPGTVGLIHVGKTTALVTGNPGAQVRAFVGATVAGLYTVD